MRWLRALIAASVMVGTAACCLGCDRGECEFRDPLCCSDDTLPPVATIMHVGLFKEEPFGEPLCRSNATVTVTQGDVEAQGERVPYFNALLIEHDGAYHQLYEDAVEPCNLYSDDGTVIWQACGAPIHYEVRVPGCEPVTGDRTWDENYLPGRGTDISWHVPVILSCDGLDGGVDPAVDAGADGAAPEPDAGT